MYGDKNYRTNAVTCVFNLNVSIWVFCLDDRRWSPKDKSTKAVLEYNTLLKEDPRIESVLLPIRDGLTISRKR